MTVAASVALAIPTTVLAWLNVGTSIPSSMSISRDSLDVASPMFALVFVATGAFIALREPRHPVAWCFLLLGLSGGMFLAFLNYGVYGTLTAAGGLPAAGVALWITAWFWSVPLTALVIAMLLFPNGRPPSARWRPLAWVIVGAMLFLAAGDALREPYLAVDVPLESPLGTPIPLEPLMWAANVATVVYVLALVGVAASLIVRFRRSRGVERQQLKWFAFAATIVVSLLLLSMVTEAASDFGTVVGVLLAASFSLIPLSTVIAILRYRMFDIDVVIERTLVYGAVTATLGATYVGTVILLQGLLRPLTGGSELAVALSTLLVVALFQPIRRRAQDAVDRRFYRARYDASRTVDAFVVRLRDEVELDSVRADLIAVIHDTIHPAHASVWLRGGRR